MALTKPDLEEIRSIFTTELESRFHDLRKTVATKPDIRDLIAHFNQSQGKQNASLEALGEGLQEVGVALAAIKEMLAFRKQLENLVRELKAQGIVLDSWTKPRLLRRLDGSVR